MQHLQKTVFKVILNKQCSQSQTNYMENSIMGLKSAQDWKRFAKQERLVLNFTMENTKRQDKKKSGTCVPHGKTILF